MSDGPPLLHGCDVLPPQEQVQAAKQKRSPTLARSRFGELNTFVDVTLQGLNRTAALVWLVLYRDTRPDGLARSAQADIAGRIGVSIRTVHTALRVLETYDLLTVVSRGGLNRGPSIYRVRAVSENSN